MDTWQKISVLIQVELSRAVLPYQQRMAIEAKQAIERMQRLLESYIVCMIADSNGHGTKVALDFSRSLLARAWEGHVAQLCQIPDIGPVNMKKLADKHVTNVLDLAGLSAVDIERFLCKNPAAAMKIADSLKSFPRLFLDGQVEKVSSDVGKHGNGIEPKAIAKVTLRCMNEQGVPRWRNKVPSVTFLAMTEEGTLLHIWRGKLQDQERQITFPVPSRNADEVFCEFSCDEVVGTTYSLQLPSVEVPWSGVTTILTANAPNTPASFLRDPESLQIPKKQKPPTYSTRPVAVGDTLVNCIDLSAADEVEPGRAYPAQIMRKRPLESSCKSHDSYAFQSMSVKKPRKCSGGGTQQDPLTLDSDDPDSDDLDAFDTDIFDNIEIPIIKELPKTTASTKKAGETPPVPVFEMRRISPPAEEKAPLKVRQTTPDLYEDGCLSLKSPPVPKLPFCSSPVDAAASVRIGTGFGCTEESLDSSSEPGKQKDDETVRIETGKSTVSPSVDGAMETSAAAAQEPSEPSWVTMSSNSVVDFLRGHVKFV